MQTNTQTHRHTDTQTHRHTDTQTHRHTDTQTHRHTDTQTYRHTDTHTRVLTDRGRRQPWGCLAWGGTGPWAPPCPHNTRNLSSTLPPSLLFLPAFVPSSNPSSDLRPVLPPEVIAMIKQQAARVACFPVRAVRAA
jgi:hypothetical protein